jgi:hypothetical protein
MKILIKPKDSGNVIATIAIGEKCFQDWKTYAFPSWRLYCKKNKLGLICFDEDLIDKNHKKWKKATWQKLLIATTLKNSNHSIKNVCYLDTDILINYKFSPNIFDLYQNNKIALVSEINDLPYPLDLVKKFLSFNRHIYYDKKYPLNSSLFISPQKIFKYHNLKPFKNYACMGLIVFSIKNHSEIMKKWFYKYDKLINTITGGGDETILNFEIQNYSKVQWLNYKFQALWIYEIAWKYPFLYNYGKKNKILIAKCIESSLKTNYFLHFAGSWHESQMWKIKNILLNNFCIIELKQLSNYLIKNVKGVINKKQIKP